MFKHYVWEKKQWLAILWFFCCSIIFCPLAQITEVVCRFFFWQIAAQLSSLVLLTKTCILISHSHLTQYITYLPIIFNTIQYNSHQHLSTIQTHVQKSSRIFLIKMTTLKFFDRSIKVVIQGDEGRLLLLLQQKKVLTHEIKSVF